MTGPAHRIRGLRYVIQGLRYVHILHRRNARIRGLRCLLRRNARIQALGCCRGIHCANTIRALLCDPLLCQREDIQPVGLDAPWVKSEKMCKIRKINDTQMHEGRAISVSVLNRILLLKVKTFV